MRSFDYFKRSLTDEGKQRINRMNIHQKVHSNLKYSTLTDLLWIMLANTSLLTEPMSTPPTNSATGKTSNNFYFVLSGVILIVCALLATLGM